LPRWPGLLWDEPILLGHCRICLVTTGHPDHGIIGLFFCFFGRSWNQCCLQINSICSHIYKEAQALCHCYCLAIFAVLSSSRSKGIENQGWQISGKHIHFDGRILFNDQDIMIPDTPLGLAGRINIIGCFAYFFILGLFMFGKLFGIFVNIWCTFVNIIANLLHICAYICCLLLHLFCIFAVFMYGLCISKHIYFIFVAYITYL